MAIDPIRTARRGVAASSAVALATASTSSSVKAARPFIVEGTAEVEVDGRTDTFSGESLVVAPALAPHALVNVGDILLRVVGFFSAAAAVHTYEAEIQPFGTDVIVTPAPEELLGWRGGR
jgi:hypothetical protein